MALAVLVAGCASKATTTSARLTGGPSAKNVLVIGGGDGATRQLIELTAVQELKTLNVTATASLALLPPVEQMTDAMLTDALTRTGADSILLIARTDARESLRWVPGRTEQGTFEGTSNRVGSLVQYQGTYTPGGTAPPTPTTVAEATFTGSLFDPKSAAMTWTAVTEAAGNAPMFGGEGLLGIAEAAGGKASQSDLIALAAREIVKKARKDGAL
jgi:hypothetical protein